MAETAIDQAGRGVLSDDQRPRTSDEVELGSPGDVVGTDEGAAGRNSLAIMSWTTISRGTGFARILAISAVLGPTYLGNTFQSVNLIPYLAFELLTGSLFASLLVPRLVRSVDERDRRTTARIAGGFLGVVVAGGLAISVVAVLAGGLLLSLVSAGVSDPGVADEQQRVGWLLLALLMPQVVLYGVGGTAGAVMNAHGRFAWPAAAPVLENAGIIATMLTFAVVFGTGGSLASVGTAEIMLLGLGTTAAVGLHAGLLWIGALRCGTPLRPRAGWRDPDVRSILRMLIPSLGYTGLGGLRLFASVIVANTVAGGVVAYMAALHFTKLPIALGARPVAVALLPGMSRLHVARSPERFGEEVVRGFGVAFFVTVPAALLYLLLCEPLAAAISFGEMDTPNGVTLLAVSLAAGALGAIAEAILVAGTYASYARKDARAPFRASVVQTVVTLVALLGVLLVSGDAMVLLVLGAAVTLGNIVSAWYLGRRFTPLLPRGAGALLPSLRRAIGGSLVMAGPAYLITNALADRISGLAGVSIAVLVGAAIYLALQRRWRSPELAFFLDGLRKPRPAAEAVR